MTNLTLTKEEINAVLTALSKFPFEQVAGTISKITEQVKEQAIAEAKAAHEAETKELTIAE